MSQKTLGDVQIGGRRSFISGEDQGHSGGGGHGDGRVLRHDPQQGQAGGVHGVIDGGAELCDELGLDPVHHEVELWQRMEFGHGPLSVAQGGGIHTGHHDGSVGGDHGELEALPKPGGRVHEDIVEVILGLIDQIVESFPIQVLTVQGGGEQEQAPYLRLFHARAQKRTTVFHHIGEVHDGSVGKPQGQVQVAQADVQIDAEHPMAQRRQAGSRASGERGLACAPLSRCDHDGSAHRTPPSDT